MVAQAPSALALTTTNTQPTVRKRELPAGTPSWITHDLVDLTLEVWQPYYAQPLRVDDAVTILRNTSNLMDVLAGR